MNKEIFCYILESALLSFDGADPLNYGISPELAKIGYNLFNYLKNIEVKPNEL